MTLDLDEARRLHERADHDPSRCRTCPDTWPCATATALGATGRSEWAPAALLDVIPFPGPGTTLDDLINAAANSTAGAGTLYVPKIIEYDPATEHISPNGVTTNRDQP